VACNAGQPMSEVMGCLGCRCEVMWCMSSTPARHVIAGTCINRPLAPALGVARLTTVEQAMQCH
jgi:hypothetical protein